MAAEQICLKRDSTTHLQDCDIVFKTLKQQLLQKFTMNEQQMPFLLFFEMKIFL